MPIRIAVLDALVEHAREDAPLECCGLLIGGPTVVDECVRTRNLRQSETAYLIDPSQHFAAIRRARSAGRVIAGAYHSHPRSPAVPSPTDLAEAQDVELLYVIVSLANPGAPDVRGYRLAQGNFVPAELVPVP
jgi:proteasome lid subunit RPN8/RPN11